LAGASVRAIGGLLVGLSVGGWLAFDAAIGAVGQTPIGAYEAIAPAPIFAIFGPSLLKLLRQSQTKGRGLRGAAAILYKRCRSTEFI
jgi:hypothetical protein